MKTIKYVIAVFVLIIANVAQAAPDIYPIEGRLVNPDGSGIQANPVKFRVEILGPTNGCRLYYVEYSKDMSQSDGYFSFSLGQAGGTRLGSGFENTSTLDQVFDNNASLISSLTCSAGTSYDPAPGDTRKVRISFDDNNDAVFETLGQLIDIGSVPFSNYASSAGSLNGLAPSAFVQVNAGVTQANVDSVFDNGSNWAELQALLAGTSSQYIDASPSAAVNFNGQVLNNVAAPAVGTDATNKTYVDANIGGNASSVGALGGGDTGKVLQWNGTNWVAVAAGNGDILNGGNAGGASPVVLGTTDGQNLVFIAGGNTQMSVLNAGGVQINNGLGVGGGIDLGSALRFQDGDSNFVGFQAPANAPLDVVWTLPNADGTSGQVLQTDGSYNLSWVTPASAPNASGIANAPAGGIVATNVQAAINELDTEKFSALGGSLGGILRLPDGGGGAPSLTFSSDTNTGLFSLTTDTLGVAAGGSGVAQFSNTQYALRLTGGLEINPYNSGAGQQGSLRFHDDTVTPGGLVAEIKAPSSLNAGYILELPVSGGANGEVLAKGAGNSLQWLPAPGGGDFYANGTIPMTGNLTLNAQSDVRFADADSSNFVNIQAPAAVPSDYTLTLPSANGTAGQVLKNDGSGNLSWADDIDTNTTVEADTLQSVVARGSASTLNMQLDGQAQLDFGDNDTNYVSFRAPANAPADIVFTLPGADGTSGQVLQTDGSGNLSWVAAAAGVTDHGALSGLVDDDHTQYALLAGRAGGQSVIGGTAAGDDITLESTSNATKGDVIIQPTAGFVGIGTNAPQYLLDVDGMAKIREVLLLADDDNSNYVGFQAASTLAQDLVWTLPDGDGSNGQVLVTDGSYNLSWSTVGGGADNLGNHMLSQNINLNGYRITGDGTNGGVFVEASGLVGIGTTAPASALHVVGTSMLQGSLMVSGVSDFQSQITLSAGSSASPGLIFANDADSGLYSQAAGDIGFVGNGVENVRILANGNVGIGVLNPGDRLVVAGSSRLDGDAFVAGDLRLGDNDNSNFVGFRSPATLFGDYVWTLPDTMGSATQVLVNNGGGQLGWQSMPGGGNFQSDGSIPMTGDLRLHNQTDLRLFESDNSNFVAFQAPSVLAGDYTWTLPNTPGTAGQVLGNSGGGMLNWMTPPGSHWSNSGNDVIYTNIGNVGIGTGAPVAKLHVDGSTKLSGNVHINGPSSFNGPLNLSGSDINNANFISANNMRIPLIDGTVNGNLTLQADDEVVLRANNSGTLNGVIRHQIDGSSIMEVSDGLVNVFAGSTLRAMNIDTNGGSVSGLNALKGSGSHIYFRNNSGNDATWFDMTNGDIIVKSPSTFASSQGRIVFEDDYFSGNAVSIRAPDSVVSTYNLRLPVNQGSAGWVLTSGGGADDQLYWMDPGTVGPDSLDALADARTTGATGVLFLGAGAGSINTGNSNTGVGIGALSANNAGQNNTALGYYSLNGNGASSNNVAVGRLALYSHNNTGGNNVAVGAASLQNFSGTGGSNTAIGHMAGTALTTGSNNTLLGFQAGDNLTTGFNNIIIGHGIDAPSSSANYALNIGDAIKGNLTNGDIHIKNELRLNDDSGNNFIAFKAPNVMSNPSYTLELPQLAGTAGQVLQNSGGGVLVWADPPAGPVDPVVEGGNSFARHMYVGTNDGYDLVFETGGVEKVRIDNATGSIGIGSTVPGYDLDILRTSSNAFASIESTWGSSMAGVRLATPGRKFELMVSDSQQKFQLRDSTAGQNRMVINSTGNVGIGTDAPTGLLNVAEMTSNNLEVSFDQIGTGAFNSVLNVRDMDDGSAIMNVEDNGFGSAESNIINFDDGDSLLTIDNQGANGQSRLDIMNSNPNGLSSIQVKSGGASSSSQINLVNEYSSMPNRIRMEKYSNSNPLTAGSVNMLEFYGDRGTNSVPAAVQTGDYLGRIMASGYDSVADEPGATISFSAANNWDSGSNYHPTEIRFSNDNAGGLVDRMVIAANGDVGIGISTPSEKLDVSGGVRATNILINSNGTAAGPSISFFGDPNSGIFNPNPDELGFSTAGNEAVLIDSSGAVGIGTDAPRAGLDVHNGAAVGKPAVNNVGSTIDFASGNMQYTTNNCGAFLLHNMKDGGSYSFVVQGATPATCSYLAYSDAGSTALTVHMPLGHGQTISSTHTMYNFMVFGNHVYVSWIKGIP